MHKRATRKMSHKRNTVSCCGEHPAWKLQQRSRRQPLPEQCGRSPEPSCGEAAGPGLISLPSTGLENMVEWLGGSTAAFSVVPCICAPTAHPEVGSETPAANWPHKVCLLPLGCFHFSVCMCKKHRWRKSKSRTNIQSWPWVFVAGRWKQNSLQQCCSGWPVEFRF